VTIKIEI